MTNVHEVITNEIVSLLETGVKPWQKEWDAPMTMPFNTVTNVPYQGVNVLSLWVSAWKNGWDSQRWGTYKQWLSVGGQVRKGEKGTSACYFSPMTRTGDDGEDYSFNLARHFKLFNVEQIDGYDEPTPHLRERSVHSRVSHYVSDALGVEVYYGPPSYNPMTDQIKMYKPEMFKSDESYMATYFHECIHSTAHKERLDRQLGKRFGDDAYAFEELIAELGAAFMCADDGIPFNIEHHASYIDHWVRRCKEDKRAIFNAAAAAQKAKSFIDSALMVSEQESELGRLLA